MVDIYVAPPKKSRPPDVTSGVEDPRSDPKVGIGTEKPPASPRLGRGRARNEIGKVAKFQSGKVSKKTPLKAILAKRTTNPLAAFVARPPNLRFETQEKKEKIVLLLRRHLITNVPWLAAALAMALFPWLVFWTMPLEFVPPPYRLIMMIGWHLLTFAFVFEKFLSWFFNVNIITDERIIDIDFPSILYRDISSTKIDQVQDVSIKVGGFVRSFFNYGDVWIQTAGTVPEIGFEAVPRPERVAEVLNDLILEEEQEKLNGRVR